MKISIALFVVLLTLLAGCTPREPSFQNVDITGASYAREFALSDPGGARRTLADYKGKVVVLFFGYTQCPDVCPTTMADLVAVKAKLGKDAERLQVIFVTLDPERDTPQVLAQYVPSFDPAFVGLTGGSTDETAKVAKEFKVFYQKSAGKKPNTYTIDHTAGSYVFDKEGRIRLVLKPGASVDSIAADLKRLI